MCYLHTPASPAQRLITPQAWKRAPQARQLAGSRASYHSLSLLLSLSLSLSSIVFPIANRIDKTARPHIKRFLPPPVAASLKCYTNSRPKLSPAKGVRMHAAPSQRTLALALKQRCEDDVAHNCIYRTVPERSRHCPKKSDRLGPRQRHDGLAQAVKGHEAAL